MKNELKKANSIREYIINTRRELHKHPEPAFKEKWTHDFIEKQLKNLGYKPKTLNKTGLTADIGKGKNRIALRADMDALPIEEENSLPHKSQNKGYMHACGHDTHMAMLLGAAKLLSEEKNPPPVRFIFQPSEEKIPGGAKGMIEEGALKGISEIYAIHIEPESEVGTLILKSGVMLAAADEMTITIKGKGAHAAEPHKSIDPIYASSLFINQTQSLVSRKADPKSPFVISICTINGGTAFNIIPEEVKMLGTVRTVEKELWQKAPEWIGDILKGLNISSGIDYELIYQRGYPILKNDPKKSESLIKIAKSIFKEINLMESPIMGGEDFAYYLKEVPGTFVFMGGANKKKGIQSKLHTARFNIDENALPLGTALFYSLATK
ncbi:amidohydrolase [candidate division WOR-3 bacterium]|nr:amidohydrolase [candidate division WOR-3 bacterium]